MIRPTIEEASVLAAAEALWGADSQIQMAYGECGEFVTLAGRTIQGRTTSDDFIDEIADVILMMAQMRRIFGKEKVDARLAYKINRLKERITNQKHKDVK